MRPTKALIALGAAALLVTGVLAAPAAATPTVYQPAQNTNWQWMLNGVLNTNNATQMGTGVTAWNGDTSPGDDPKLYDVDGILNSAATVSTLHGLGDHAICYIEVGTAGNYYTAADEGIPTTYYTQLQTAGDLGKKLKGYPEWFININAPSTVTIIEAMIQQQCAAKGFDAVETDLDETFGNNEGATGFTITQANEETYLESLANYMHGIGLGWIAKNLDDTGVASFVNHLQPYAQGIISEQCNQYSTCNLLSPFLTAGKWIGNAEYKNNQATFCPADNSANMNGIYFPNTGLTGPRKPCR